MAHYAIAAALAALVLGTFGVTPSRACTDDRYLCEPATATTPARQLLLQDYARLASQKKSANSATEISARKERPKRARPSRTSPEKQVEPEPQPSDSASDEPAVVIVRTTRETTGESVPVVSANELSEIDQAAPAISLMAVSIMSYLGGPAAIDDAKITQYETLADVPVEARETFASAETDNSQKPAKVALEYILMTFGGALAAASAIRLFVV